MSATAPTGFDLSSRIRRTASRSRTLVIAVAIATALAFVGFWPTYFGPLLVGTVDAVWLTHLHAAVQVSWLALFGMQIYFATIGRIDLHIRFGRWAMALSAVFLSVALVLCFDKFGRHVALGEIALGQRKLGGFLREIIFIGAWFYAGWAYRRKPELHKRIMVVALIMMIYPSVGRMKFLGDPPTLLTWMIVWPLPMYMMMIRDFVKQRMVHPVYVLGLLSALAMRLVLPLTRTETWMSISAWFVPLYQNP